MAAITGIDHVQITIPVGAEADGRRFYCDFLGLPELPKPAALHGRGGFWLRVGDGAVHVGVQDGVERAASRAHVAYAVDDLAAWRARLAARHIPVGASVPIPGYDRLEFRDPFGNRVELIQPVDEGNYD